MESARELRYILLVVTDDSEKVTNLSWLGQPFRNRTLFGEVLRFDKEIKGNDKLIMKII